MPWPQNYDPTGNAALSTLLAALPVIVLLGSIAALRIRIHFAALMGLAIALAVAIFICRMPLGTAAAATAYGAAYGLFPIGWIILNLIFLYQLTVEKGFFSILRTSLASLSPDPRVQVILIAFSLGAFFEGAAGFGTPVAVTAAILMQLGFRPVEASGLSLIANTAPVAFGALGTPIIALSKTTGISAVALSAMVGRQLPFFSMLVPFWVVWAMAGWRGMLEIWPVALTAGLAFAVPQFLISNLHGPWLVDIVSAISSMGAIAVLVRFWQPKRIWKFKAANAPEQRAEKPIAPIIHTPQAIRRAWAPWILLSGFVFLWGLPQVTHSLNHLSSPEFAVTGLHNAVIRTPPVVPLATPDHPIKPEPAIFAFNWLSATGTGILAASILAGWAMGFSAGGMLRVYWKTLVMVRFSLVTIAAMLALGFVTRYSGTDATLGLALARTGKLYPFFGTLLGWLGVALTGSDTASNVLFGGLQRITAEQTGLPAVLMAAANSSGGVMGKMLDAQSIVVASTATECYGIEGNILRYVFFHSLALATLMGILVFLQAHVAPFSSMVVSLHPP